MPTGHGEAGTKLFSSFEDGHNSNRENNNNNNNKNKKKKKEKKLHTKNLRRLACFEIHLCGFEQIFQGIILKTLNTYFNI